MDNTVCCVSNADPNGPAVCLTVKPVGEPDALIGHVRFDERGWETERCRMAQATAPILDSTETVMAVQSPHVCCREQSGKHLLGMSISHFDPLRTCGLMRFVIRPIALLYPTFFL